MAEMLPAQRQQQIVDRLNANGQVRVNELAAALGVSDMTIRRDLTELEARGTLVKVHGGATREAAATSLEPGFAAKLQREAVEKFSIAGLALSMIRPGMAIALNSGTTTFALAERLSGIQDLTVVTNSPRIADVLWQADNSSQSVILTGGVRTPSDALVGPLALAGLSQLHVDLCFMGVHGFTLEDGFTTPNMLEAQTNQAFMACAAQVAVLADHTKWGITGLSQIAPVSAVDYLLSDAGLPAKALAGLRRVIDVVQTAPAA
ncbi:DeoR/GlpR transcriptional regulator [Arthrobacter sp. Sa2CUA1]|uniref:DeoR/GlpR transcriptional regulator n=1 Tax=Arthrobacter gallicola TaxID=2762225 RepID=A0ABR8UN84_9MICC|nr:DeoR/GlpR family DNA-binding transcription regulator [Arthrobacter gallicola]MBD7994019.1 DeoR/GlpR transcriptional regulator [Arthrobacter gallicola]